MPFAIATNKQGPLPLTIPFTSPVVGPASLAIAGTVWTKTAGQTIGIEVLMNGAVIGIMQICANQASVHLALPTAFFNAKFPSQSATLTIQALNPNTTSDFNDYFSAWIMD
jgi:hypothetical protein